MILQLNRPLPDPFGLVLGETWQPFEPQLIEFSPMLLIFPSGAPMGPEKHELALDFAHGNRFAELFAVGDGSWCEEVQWELVQKSAL